MTREQAKCVKRWRMEDNETWRGIAQIWVEAYGEEELTVDGWGPGLSGNQLVGIELCERASAILGEYVD